MSNVGSTNYWEKGKEGKYKYKVVQAEKAVTCGKMVPDRKAATDVF